MQQRNSSTPTEQRGGIVSGTAAANTIAHQCLSDEPLTQAKTLSSARFSAAC